MRFASLGSGSSGNATLIECGDTALLVDCGFSVRETERRLQRLGYGAERLSALLVTHEHSDHAGGIAALARKYNLPVYATRGTVRGCRPSIALQGWSRLQRIEPGVTFTVGAIEVLPVPVLHDAGEPCQYRFDYRGRRFGLLTDLGSIDDRVVEAYRGCDALLLECNHDRDMLRNGPYPWPLKQRVGGPLGHLSNAQAAELLASLQPERLQLLAMAHLSLKNNTEILARAAVAPLLRSDQTLLAAHQMNGLAWCEVV